MNKIFKSQITKVPIGCICEMQELPNKALDSAVKAYTIFKECDICKNIREQDEIKFEEERIKEQQKTETNNLINTKMREMVIAELKKEGKLSSDGEIVK